MGSSPRPSISLVSARPGVRFARTASLLCPMTRVRMSGWTSYKIREKNFDTHVLSFFQPWNSRDVTKRFQHWSEAVLSCSRAEILDFHHFTRFVVIFACFSLTKCCFAESWSILPIQLPRGCNRGNRIIFPRCVHTHFRPIIELVWVISLIRVSLGDISTSVLQTLVWVLRS